MNLTNFHLQTSSNLETSTGANNILKPPPTSSTPSIQHSLMFAPEMIQKLGETLEKNQEHAVSYLAQKLKITGITPNEDFETSNKVLIEILQKMNQLVQANLQLEDHSSIPYEIRQLEEEVQILEKEFGEMELSEQELHNLKEITNKFYLILSSMENWLSFQRLYFVVDDLLFNSLNSVQASTYSDLHGWSPAAFESVEKSLNHMMILIALTKPALRQGSAFTSDILNQLSSSIYATTWYCEDFFHVIFTHYDDVLSNAEQQWKQANAEFEHNFTLEAYTQMHLAAQQLQSMKQLLEVLIRAIPQFVDFMSVAKNIDIEKKNQQNLVSLIKTLGDEKKKIPGRLKQLKTIIEDNAIEAALVGAQKPMNIWNYKTETKAIINEYRAQEPNLDRYVTAKRKLSGLIFFPDSQKLYPEAHAFCEAEERRFNRKEQNPIDFNALVMNQFIKLGQPQPGIFSRMLTALTPDPTNWSKRTKRWVHVGFIGLQLVDQLSKMAPQVKSKNPASSSAVLTEEEQKIIDKETTWLRGILEAKFKFLKNPEAFEKLAKRAEAIKPVLRVIVDHYNTLSLQQRTQLVDGYRTYRQEVLLTGSSNLDWITKYADAPSVQIVKSPVNLISASKTHEKTGKLATSTIKATGSFMEAFSATPESPSLEDVKQEVSHELKQAVRAATMLDRDLRECRKNVLTFQPTTPLALGTLRDEVALLRRSLSETIINKPAEQSPVPVWIEWSQLVQKKCYDLNHLEKRVANAMEIYDEAVAMNGAYDTYTRLDVYGNKHKNLVKQAHIAAAVGMQGLEVPMPQGISSTQVLKFLKIHAPEIFDYWNKIGALYDRYPQNILKEKQVLSHLKAIDEGIKQAFSNASKDDSILKDLGISKEFKVWLATLAKENKFLMVRSTGDEDSKKSANAGANLSLSYVNPSLEEVCKAFGEVIRSYFGIGSLRKRLHANLNPFKEELKVAVTTQELIGEELGGAKDSNQIPISLVLFSAEPLLIGDEIFRAMRISATYGHGEGVVGNKGIAGDTILILISPSDPSKLYILYDNQEKPERLAPVIDKSTGKVSLEKIPNTEKMAKNPVLTHELIARLYEWGIVGEKYFGGDPTDMEIVIEGKINGEKIIKPVQARPINRPKLNASYLDLKKISEAAVSPIEKTIKTEMVVPGKASVIEITSPNEILIAETLEMAEGLFKKGQHKLIVIGQSEPANSHPVINFSALGMPCFFAKNLDEVQNVLEEINQSHQLAVCTQSAKLSLWDVSKGEVKDFTSEGFVVHPAKIAISFPLVGSIPVKAGVYSEVPEQVTNLLSELGSAINGKTALKRLDDLKNHPWVASLQTTIDQLQEKIVSRPLSAKKIIPVIQVARALNEKIQESLFQLEVLLKQPKKTGRLEWLFHVKTLGTLFIQKPVSQGAIAQYSLLSLQESFAAAEDLLAYQNQLSHPAYFSDVLLYGSHSPLEEKVEQWKVFLLKLEQITNQTFQGKETGLTINEISKFKAALNKMSKAEVLPLFLTFFFNQANFENPIETLQSVIKLLPEEESPVIDQIFLRKKAIREIRNKISGIGNPKAYSVLFAKLQQEVDDFLTTSQPWLEEEQWGKTSPMTRSIALQTMNDLVDLYDTAIKTMKASTEIHSEKEKIQKFKEMLAPYLKLFQNWAQEIVGSSGYATHRSWHLEKYLGRLETIFQDLSERDFNEQLLPSRRFSVNAAVLGAGTDFERHIPETLEDFFTLIHQNLMGSTATLTKALFSEKQMQGSHLPQNLYRAINKGMGYCIGIDVNKFGITFYYNFPLRNHSGKYSIHYDRQSQKLTMNAQFLGLAWDRWDQGAEKAIILDVTKMLPLLSKPKVTPQELSLAWDISDTKHLDHAFFEYRHTADVSMGENTNFYIRNFCEKIVQAEKLSEAAVWLSKSKKLTQFGRHIISEFINTIKADDPFAKSDEMYLMLLRSQSHYNPFIKALLSYINGDDVERPPAQIQASVEDIMKYQIEFNFAKEPGLSNTIIAAFEIIESRNEDLIAYQLLKKMVEKRIGIDQIFAASLEGTQDDVWSVKYASFAILTAILEKENDLPDRFFPAAEKGIENINDMDRSWNNLLIALINKGKRISEVMSIAQKGMMNSEKIVREKSFEILGEILESGIDLPETFFAAAQNGMIDSTWGIRKNWIDVLERIIEKRKSIQEVIAIAQMGIMNGDSFAKIDSFNILTSIFESQNDLPKIFFDVVQKSMKTVSYNVVKWLETFKDLINQRIRITEIMTIAQTGLIYGDKFIREASLKIFQLCIESENEIPETIFDAAQKGILDTRRDTRNVWRELLELLITNKKGINEAIPIAETGLVHSNYEVKQTSIGILSTIVENANKIPEAVINIILNGIEDGDIRNDLLVLLKTLIKKTREAPEVLIAAQKWTMSNDKTLKKVSCEILRAVIESANEIPEVNVSILLNGIEDSHIREDSLNLVKMLLKKTNRIPEVLSAAQKWMMSNDKDLRKAYYEILKTVVENENEISETIAVNALKGMEDNDPDLRKSVLEIFRILIQKEKVISVAIDAVEKGIYSSYPDQQKNSLILIDDFEGKEGTAFVAIAKKGMNSHDSHTQESALNLFNHLIARNIDLSDIITIALDGVKHDDFNIVNFSFKLLRQLIGRDKGAAAAQEFIDQDWHYWHAIKTQNLNYLELVEQLRKALYIHDYHAKNKLKKDALTE